MNHEYKASGGISINTQTDHEVEYVVTMYEEYIMMPLLYVPNRKVVRTTGYAILLDGSIANAGFNDEFLINYTFKDRVRKALSFFIGGVL